MSNRAANRLSQIFSHFPIIGLQLDDPYNLWTISPTWAFLWYPPSIKHYYEYVAFITALDTSTIVLSCHWPVIGVPQEWRHTRATGNLHFQRSMQPKRFLRSDRSCFCATSSNFFFFLIYPRSVIRYRLLRFAFQLFSQLRSIFAGIPQRAEYTVRGSD